MFQAGLPGIGDQVGRSGLGPAPGSGTTGMGIADAVSGMTNPRATYLAAPAPDSYLPPMPGDAAGQAGLGGAPIEPSQPAGAAAPDDYRTRVDVDGDGHWETHIAVGRADGGVEIYVDGDGWLDRTIHHTPPGH